MTTLGGIAFGSQIETAAARYHLDPTLLAAVAAQETGGLGATSGRNIVGDEGHGHGLFQIDDRSHAFASTPAAMDPAQNADYAASMISGLMSRFGGNVREALSAYNTGSPTATGTTTNWGGKTLAYADSVLAHVAQLSGTRDAQIADLPETSASVNSLASLATAQTAAGATPSGDSVAASTVAVQMPAAHAQTSSADRAKMEAAPPLVDDDAGETDPADRIDFTTS